MKNFENSPKARKSKDAIPDDVLAAIERHALSDSSNEVCGFVYSDRYIPLRNVSGSRYRFYADPAELAVILAGYGEPQAIFHTHPEGELTLSSEDLRLWYYSNSTMIVGCLENGRLRWKMYGNRGH